MRRVVSALAAVVLATVLGGGAAAPDPSGRWVPLEVTPLDLRGGDYSGVRLTGAWRLDSAERAFGGISGLLVEGRTVNAITDQGWWIAGRRGPAGLEPRIALQPMTGADGRRYNKAAGDAEDLTRRDGRLIVSFERDHRIAAHVGHGRIGRTVQRSAMERLPTNGGMEALTTLPDGRLMAIAEEPDAGGFPVFLVDQQGEVTETRLPRVDRHKVTGADMGPDGRLYLLQRHFSLLTGLSIRLLRYHLGPDGLPDPRTAETLAAWDSASGIDNMEGIAAFQDDPAGPVKLWLISDDNFNAIQRTILVELEVE